MNIWPPGWQGMTLRSFCEDWRDIPTSIRVVLVLWAVLVLGSHWV